MSPRSIGWQRAVPAGRPISAMAAALVAEVMQTTEKLTDRPVRAEMRPRRAGDPRACQRLHQGA
jgi:UDP-glucose 4-epimerase